MIKRIKEKVRELINRGKAAYSARCSGNVEMQIATARVYSAGYSSNRILR